MCTRKDSLVSTGFPGLVITHATNVQVVEMALAGVAAAKTPSATPDPLLALEPKRFGVRRYLVLVSNFDRDTRAPESPLGEMGCHMSPEIRHPPVLLFITAHWADVAKLITEFAVLEGFLYDRH